MLALVWNLHGQSSQACNSSEHRQFDFWLGNWEVFNQKGIKVGENLIHYVQDSCVIQENWKSAQLTGTSFNYYDPTDKTWNQLYLDNKGSILKLKGAFVGGKMILESEMVKGKNYNYKNIITWQILNEGSVSQKWDIVDSDGKILSVAFDGIYKRM